MLSLIQHGAIETTEAKAKSIRGLADTMIHRAQNNSMATARVLASFFGTREIVQKLMKEVAPAMKDRVSGFTRIIRLGRRQGDNSEMVRLELVQKPEVKEGKSCESAHKADAK
jgi:large subunit ribosomal protein L17